MAKNQDARGTLHLRARTIHPSVLSDYDLFRLEAESGLPVRLVYLSLFLVADRSGRFLFDANLVAHHVLPYDRNIDIARIVSILEGAGYIHTWERHGHTFAGIQNWDRMQHINPQEPRSTIIGPDGRTLPVRLSSRRRRPRDAMMKLSPGGDVFGDEEYIPEDSVPANDSPANDTIPAVKAVAPKVNGQPTRMEGDSRCVICATTDDESDAIGIWFPVVGDPLVKEASISFNRMNVYASLYPEGADITGSLKRAAVWCMDNTSRQKTLKGFPKFINNWLKSAQQNGELFPVHRQNPSRQLRPAFGFGGDVQVKDLAGRFSGKGEPKEAGNVYEG